MANTLGNYNVPLYANEALIYLKKALGLAPRLHLGFDAERRTFNKGDTINIRRPAIFTAQTAPSSAQDAATESVAISLTTWDEVKVGVTDKEVAYVSDRFIQEHVGPAAYALADKIDQNLATMVVTVPHAVSQATPFAATIAGLLSTRQALFDNKVPMNDPNMMNFMVGGKEEGTLLGLEAFAQYQGAGDTGAATQMSGYLGKRYGLNFFANQNVTTNTYADVTDKAGAINNGAGYAKGTTSIAVDGLDASGVYKKGTVIKITLGADLGSEYAITADATMSTGAATITINPGLRNAVADNDTFSVQTEHDNVTTMRQNVAFHRDWAAIAFARLPDYAEFSNQLGAQIFSIQDPVTGLALRARFFYEGNNSKLFFALDALYGWKELNADLACRYETQ